MLQLVLTKEFYKAGYSYASFPFSPSEQDQVEGKQRYLANVKAFCSRSKNNWHRVYLVRKIVSQHGMEFAQKLVTEAQFNWMFPVEILQQVKAMRLLGDGSGLSSWLCCFGGVPAAVWLPGDSPQREWL